MSGSSASRALYYRSCTGPEGLLQFFGRVDVAREWFFHAPVPPEPRRQFRLPRPDQKVRVRVRLRLRPLGFWDLRVASPTRYQWGACSLRGCGPQPPAYGASASTMAWKTLPISVGNWREAARVGSDALSRSYGEERRPIFEESAKTSSPRAIRRTVHFSPPPSERDRRNSSGQEGAGDEVGSRVRAMSAL